MRELSRRDKINIRKFLRGQLSESGFKALYGAHAPMLLDLPGSPFYRVKEKAKKY